MLISKISQKNILDIDENLEKQIEILREKYAQYYLAELRDIIKRSGFNYSRHTITICAGNGSCSLNLNNKSGSIDVYRGDCFKLLRNIENELQWDWCHYLQGGNLIIFKLVLSLISSKYV